MADQNGSNTSFDCRDPRLRNPFQNRKEAIDKIKWIAAVEQGKSLMIDQAKKNSISVVMGCADRLAKGKSGTCPVSIRVTKRKKDGLWHASKHSYNMEHIKCMGEVKVSSRMLSKQDAVVIALRANRCISAKALQQEVHGHTNVLVKRSMLYRVKNMVNGETEDKAKQNYYLLESYASKFRELNPESTLVLEWDAESRFKRVFVCHGSALHVLKNSAQNVAMHDCAFMKAPYYNGQFMAMSIVDGNLNNVLLAYALVPAEDHDNYTWFFELLKGTGEETTELLNHASFAHISDRDKGSMSAVPQAFPVASAVHCFKHIVAKINSNRNIPNLGPRVRDLWAVQAAPNSAEYEALLTKISEYNPAAAQYLRDIGGDWALHTHVQHKVALHGHRTSNCIESENSRYLEARELEPLYFLNKMTRVQLDLNNKSRDNVPAWEQKRMLLTARVQAVYNKQELMSNEYVVAKINNTQALVPKPGDESVERTVESNDGGGLRGWIP